MTENEWLACTDPTRMLEFLRGKASDRKLRLFAVACCRRVRDLLSSERSRTALDVAERYADGLATAEDVGRFTQLGGSDSELPGASQEAEYAATQTCLVSPSFDGAYSAFFASHHSAIAMANRLLSAEERLDRFDGVELAFQEQAIQFSLLRDITGNPFRSLSADPAWLTSTAVSLAQAIYADRAFDRLPILADALEEAGCDNADILAHCRGDGPHVRGCWAVDLVLGKE